jgi:hypothetical protein
MTLMCAHEMRLSILAYLASLKPTGQESIRFDPKISDASLVPRPC